MALSKHTTAGTQGKGDRGSWGSTGRDRRRSGGEGFFWGGGHEMSSCNLEPLSPPSLALTITEQTAGKKLNNVCLKKLHFFSSNFLHINQHNSCLKTIQATINRSQDLVWSGETKALGGLVPGNSTTQRRIRKNRPLKFPKALTLQITMHDL